MRAMKAKRPLTPINDVPEDVVSKKSGDAGAGVEKSDDVVVDVIDEKKTEWI